MKPETVIKCAAMALIGITIIFMGLLVNFVICL